MNSDGNLIRVEESDMIALITMASALTIFVFGTVAFIQAYHQGSAMQRSTLSEMATNKDTVITFDEYAVDYTEQLRWSFNAL